MVKLYLDSQVYRYLKSGENKSVVGFDNLIGQRSDLFLISFSHAHLLDLKRDSTEKKYDDLKFMEKYVGSRYLCYYESEKAGNSYIATPLEAFKEVENEAPIQDIFDYEDLREDPSTRFLANILDRIYNQKITFPIPDLGEQPNESLRFYDSLFGGKYEYTLREWAEKFLAYSDYLLEDKDEYKDLRKMVQEYSERLNLEYDGTSSFDQKLKESYFQKSFRQFVLDSCYKQDKSKITNFDFFINAYYSLDMLGISKEPLSKKNRLKNLFNDAHHAYYGAFNDYLIAEDAQLLKKASIIYQLLNIETKALSVNQFMQGAELLTRNHFETITSFLKSLTYDIRHGVRLSIYNSYPLGRYTEVVKCLGTYLGHFNHMVIFQENGTYVVLERSSKNYAHYTLYEEFENVTNRAIELFGLDKYGIGQFNTDIEIEQIRNNSWKGRTWDLNDYLITLEKNEGTKEFSLVIGPID
jgi:hypothetical protein